MKKILITGITGFAGSFLAEHIVAEKNVEIIGTYVNEKSLKNISHIREKLDVRKVNLIHKDEVDDLINATKPDEIYHLAAMASVGDSFSSPLEVVHNNIDSEFFILDSVRKGKFLQTKVLIISSAEVYGHVQSTDLPIDEKTPLQPANSYAVSKIAQDFLGLQYHITYNMPIIRARPFNHIGPRQALGFVVSDFASQIAAIERGEAEPVIHVGNLDARRDFTDVRDMVKAYMLLMEKGKEGEVYNIGSGVSHKIDEILDILIRLSTKKISKEIDPARLRLSDSPEILADNSKIKNLTNWYPTIQLQSTLKDTLDYWRDIG